MTASSAPLALSLPFLLASAGVIFASVLDGRSFFGAYDSLPTEGEAKSGGHVVFSVKSKWFAAAHPDRKNEISIWNGSTGNKKQLIALAAPADSMAFSPDESQIAMAVGDQIYVHDIDSGEVKQHFKISGESRFIGFSPDNALLIAISEEKIKSKLTVWDVRSGKQIASRSYRPWFDFSGMVLKLLDVETPNVDARFTKDGKSFVAAGMGRLVTVWDTQTWQRSRTLNVLPMWRRLLTKVCGGLTVLSSLGFAGFLIAFFAFFSRGDNMNRFSVVVDHGPLLLFFGGAGAILISLFLYAVFKDIVTKTHVSLSGNAIAVETKNDAFTSRRQYARYVDISSGRRKHFDEDFWALSGDGSKMVTFSVRADPTAMIFNQPASDPYYVVWDTKTGKPILEISELRTGFITSFFFAPDGKSVFAVTAKGSVITWDLVTKRERVLIKGSKENVGYIANWSEDGRRLALVNSEDGSVTVLKIGHTEEDALATARDLGLSGNESARDSVGVFDGEDRFKIDLK